MKTSLFFDPLFLEHQPGRGHPESPERLKRILEVLERNPLSGTERRQPRPATDEELGYIHTETYRSRLKSIAGKSVELDPDTHTSPKSYDAAVLAGGAA